MWASFLAPGAEALTGENATLLPLGLFTRAGFSVGSIRLTPPTPQLFFYVVGQQKHMKVCIDPKVIALGLAHQPLSLLHAWAAPVAQAAFWQTSKVKGKGRMCAPPCRHGHTRLPHPPSLSPFLSLTSGCSELRWRELSIAEPSWLVWQ